MLSPLGLDDKNIGLIGFLFNLFLFIGSISSGFVAGSCFQGKLKLFLINMYSLAAIVIFILLLILPSPLKQDGSLIILNDNSSDLTKNVILNSLIGLYGLLLGGTAASGYELLAEVSYPCSEGTSTTALVFVTNATTLIFVGIGIVNTTYETLLSLILIILSVVALLFVREEYKRGNVH